MHQKKYSYLYKYNLWQIVLEARGQTDKCREVRILLQQKRYDTLLPNTRLYSQEENISVKHSREAPEGARTRRWCLHVRLILYCSTTIPGTYTNDGEGANDEMRDGANGMKTDTTGSTSTKYMGFCRTHGTSYNNFLVSWYTLQQVTTILL